MSDVSIPSERLRDGYSRRDGGPTRDPNRSPMQWSDADNAGFNDGGVEPWLPLAPDWRERNVQAELEDPRSVLNLYRRLIELRRRSSALRAGSIHFVDPAPYDCLVYRRTDVSQAVTVALNFGSEPCQLVTDAEGPMKISISSGLDRDGEVVSTGTLTLRPYEGVVLEPVVG